MNEQHIAQLNAGEITKDTAKLIFHDLQSYEQKGKWMVPIPPYVQSLMEYYKLKDASDLLIRYILWKAVAIKLAKDARV